MKNKITLYTAYRKTTFLAGSEIEKDVEFFLEDLKEVFISNSEMNQHLGLTFKVYTSENKIQIQNFIDNYKNRHPSVKILINVFSKIELNEMYACLIGNRELSKKDFNEVNEILKSSRTSYESDQNFIRELLGELPTFYEIRTLGYHRETFGTRDKNKRICRFCNKGNSEVTFKNKAHAISEALGNKKIITLDECDTCNEYFGETIENDIISYFSFLRAVYGIKGKGGIKKLKGTNFDVSREGRLTKINLKESSKKASWLKLEKPIIYQNVYKSFCKYFLSVVDKENLKYFEKTIEWINGDYSFGQLPLVAENNSNSNNLSKEPKMAYYLRKEDDKKLPFAVISFFLAGRIVILIVPFSSKDDRAFTESQDYNHFWLTFKHFRTKKDWNFVDFTKMIDDNLYIVNTNKFS